MKRMVDYEIVLTNQGREWQVWTPDYSGACIGAGPTKEEAIRNAHAALLLTAIHIMNQTYEKP